MYWALHTPPDNTATSIQKQYDRMLDQKYILVTGGAGFV
jgi:hypothetical protein